MPDNSSIREHTLEDALYCIQQSGNVSVPNTGGNNMNNGEYIWRARDNRSQPGVTN